MTMDDRAAGQSGFEAAYLEKTPEGEGKPEEAEEP